MKTPGAVLIGIVLYLIALAIGTYVVLFILEAAAIAVPSVQTYLSCPGGTSIQYTWVQETWDQPGQKTMIRDCIDGNGVKQDAFSNEVYGQRQYDLFLPISFVVMLAIEILWGIIRYLQGRKKLSTPAAALHKD